MNYIGIIILITLLIHFIINIFSSYLNIKHLKKEIPQGFEKYFDKTKYEKSQEYILINSKFDIISDTFNFLILIIFWFSGGFGFLDKFVRSLDFGFLARGILYIGILVISKAILELPFSYYSTFVIEEKFGFNKTDLKLYITDKIKVFFLSAIIGIPLISVILLFFKYTGPFSWIWCWAGVGFFMIILQIVFPVWIMPLFNKFTPLEDGELKNRVMSFAKENNFPIENVFVMDGSKRSGKSNAFFTGFGKNKRLVLFDTIIEKHSTDEIIAILAHETGHYKKKHISMTTVMGILQMGLMFFILSFFISFKDLFTAFYVSDVSIYAGLVFFGFLYTPADFFIGLGMLAVSRRNEFQADSFAVVSTKRKEPLIETLKKLSADNYSNLVPHPFYVFLNYSHPPVLSRIKNIKETVIDNKI
ncbi:MAG: peptidase M48 [Deltaproteobacteria bacterium]|nr:MAG: peptidase M48 [Deltaproteobacteria bacterium]